MYLSRVEIDFANRKKTKSLDHLGAYHNWVEKMFPEEIEKGKKTRKLWRVDKLQGKYYLLIVSETKPDHEAFLLYGVNNSGQTVAYDHFLNRLQEDQVVRFKATLNPVKSLSTGKKSGKRGRVVPHISLKHQMDYLKEKAEKNGFVLNDNEYFITESGFKTLKRSGGKTIQISVVSYEGVLKITDINLFKEMLVKGLGKKKAFGCGLMTVIPGI